VENLYERLERMAMVNPAWVDVTWGAGGSTAKLTHEICHNAQNFVGLETMMHLTCTNMPREDVKNALQAAKDSGIRNILALRGDPPRGEEWKQIEGGFAHAVDLVKFIRQEFGDFFGVCVAGYPEGHIDCTTYREDLQFLKEKVDAGADLIITQLFYDCNKFIQFMKDCREIGINCPILPGIMPIHGYQGFARMTSMCKTYIPPEITAALEPLKNDDEAVKNYGVKLGIEMCKTLLESGVSGVHFYTLNLEKSVLEILEGLELIEKDARRPLPWEFWQTKRANEDVRPIFWSHRPKSYVTRTSSWDEFPNGRWGDSRSPAFGDLTDYHLMIQHSPPKVQSKAEAWGKELKTAQDIYDVFASYCAGKLEQLPWCDGRITSESDPILDQLVKINKMGFLSINSQPRVNGVPSTHEKFGWGPVGGYVYQKAYLEFFASPQNVQELMEAAKKFPSLTFHAISLKGQEYWNVKPHVSAVTWGVFPNKEIIQPTVVDPDSYGVWKDEAFALWNVWGHLYEDKTHSRKLIETVVETYFLVNVVDNDYVNGDIFAVFDQIARNKDMPKA